MPAQAGEARDLLLGLERGQKINRPGGREPPGRFLFPLATNFFVKLTQGLAAKFALRRFFALNYAYFTMPRLCTPANTENPDPAACGNHHNLRTQRSWLAIMRLPI